MASVNNTIRLNDQMTPVLRNIVKALETTLTVMSKVDSVGKKDFNSLKQAVDNATNSVNKLNTAGTQSQNNFTNSVRNSSSAMDGLIGKAKTLLGTYLGFKTIANVVTGGDQFIGNTARLGLAIDIAKQHNEELTTTKELQDQIYYASQRSLGSYTDMQAAVSKLGITAGHAFKNTKEIVAFTELLNKQFTIGGASASERAGATYQLTQAMASGRLQGDEFRSILENAPMLMQAIQKSTGMDFKQLKDAAPKGLITSEVIKKALFDIAQETNDKFLEIPMSFGNLWQQVLNMVEQSMQPLYIKLRELWNNEDFQIWLQGMVSGFTQVVNMGIWAFGALATVGKVFYDNWDMIAPLIWGVVAAMTAYGVGVGILKLAAIWTGILTTAQFIYAAATTLATNGIRATVAALGANIAAQWGLNAALLACPITWIVLGIIAIISVIYLVVGAINHFAGTAISATGIIFGAFAWLGAVIWNVFAGLVNGLIQLLWTVFIYPSLVGIEFWMNAFSGGFDTFGDKVKYLIGNIISWFMQLGTVVTKIIDAIFGTDWTAGLNNLNTKMQQWANSGKNNKGITLNKNVPSELVLNRMEYGKAWNAGYSLGEKSMNKVKDAFRIGDRTQGLEDMFTPGDYGGASNVAKDIAGTKKNTDKIANDGVSINDEDIELLKEVARVQFVNKFTSLTPKVNATFGDVRESADVNKIIQIIEQSVVTALDAGLSTF